MSEQVSRAEGLVKEYDAAVRRPRGKTAKHKAYLLELAAALDEASYDAGYRHGQEDAAGNVEDIRDMMDELIDKMKPGEAE